MPIDRESILDRLYCYASFLLNHCLKLVLTSISGTVKTLTAEGLKTKWASQFLPSYASMPGHSPLPLYGQTRVLPEFVTLGHVLPRIVPQTAMVVFELATFSFVKEASLHRLETVQAQPHSLPFLVHQIVRTYLPNSHYQSISKLLFFGGIVQTYGQVSSQALH